MPDDEPDLTRGGTPAGGSGYAVRQVVDSISGGIDAALNKILSRLGQTLNRAMPGSGSSVSAPGSAPTSTFTLGGGGSAGGGPVPNGGQRQGTFNPLPLLAFGAAAARRSEMGTRPERQMVELNAQQFSLMSGRGGSQGSTWQTFNDISRNRNITGFNDRADRDAGVGSIIGISGYTPNSVGFNGMARGVSALSLMNPQLGGFGGTAAAIQQQYSGGAIQRQMRVGAPTFTAMGGRSRNAAVVNREALRWAAGGRNLGAEEFATVTRMNGRLRRNLTSVYGEEAAEVMITQGRYESKFREEHGGRTINWSNRADRRAAGVADTEYRTFQRTQEAMTRAGDTTLQGESASVKRLQRAAEGAATALERIGRLGNGGVGGFAGNVLGLGSGFATPLALGAGLSGAGGGGGAAGGGGGGFARGAASSMTGSLAARFIGGRLFGAAGTAAAGGAGGAGLGTAALAAGGVLAAAAAGTAIGTGIRYIPVGGGNNVGGWLADRSTGAVGSMTGVHSAKPVGGGRKHTFKGHQVYFGKTNYGIDMGKGPTQYYAYGSGPAASLKPETGDGPGGGGGGGSTYGALSQIVQGMGGRVTSTTGGKHASGSYHYKGQAVDVAGQQKGDSAAMLRIDQQLAAQYGSGLKELIYGGPGAVNLKDGKPHQYSAAILAQHKDHVHVAADPAGLGGGGPLAGGGAATVGQAGGGNWAPIVVGKFSGGAGALTSWAVSGKKQTYGTSAASGAAPANGSAVGGSVGGWVAEALGVLGLDAGKYSKAIQTIIQHESGGNAKAQNNWDSNAKAGHPSKGIMQTIDSTFNKYKMPGHDDIWNPVDNIIAATRYAISRYGSMDNVPGIKSLNSGGGYKGYAKGAWEVDSDQMAYIHKGEMIVPDKDAQQIRAASRDPFAKGGSGRQTILNFHPGSIVLQNGSESEARQFVKVVMNEMAKEDRYEKIGSS